MSEEESLNSYRIGALETGLAEQRALLTAGFERINAKMDSLLKVEVRHERTWEDLQNAWRVIHELEQLMATLRELPGMKLTLFGQDGQGGLVFRTMASEESARALDRKISAVEEVSDDRLDVIEATLEGAGDDLGLSKRVTNLEHDGKIVWRLIKIGGAAVASLTAWIAINIGDKLKAIFFHGP